MLFLENTKQIADISIGEACLIAIVCIAIVFSMLALLWGIVSLFKYLPNKDVKEQTKVVKKENTVTVNHKKLSLSDIKDDDMMAAALVASIDYHNEIKKDVRVVSVKEL